MGHDHSHASARAGARHARRLWMAFWLIVGFLLVQVVAALVTGSLTLLSDAGHMATDALGLGMALAAIAAANKATHTGHRTFGLYRLEILAALANAVLLFGVAAWVLVEAARRLGDPPEIASGAVLVVGVVGLAVNIGAFFLLRRGATESLNVRGAYVEVLADLLGSIGVVVSALVMGVTGWGWVDPVLGAAIAVTDPGRTQQVLREARTVLAERFQLTHATLQVESGDLHDCEGMTW